jgi:hypothetical protein
LVFAVFVYINFGTFEALLGEYANPSFLHGLSTISSVELKAFDVYLIKFSTFKTMFRETQNVGGIWTHRTD